MDVIFVLSFCLLQLASISQKELVHVSSAPGFVAAAWGWPWIVWVWWLAGLAFLGSTGL